MSSGNARERARGVLNLALFGLETIDRDEPATDEIAQDRMEQGRLVGVARIESALRYSRGLRHGVHRRAVETELHEYFAGDARNMLISLFRFTRPGALAATCRWTVVRFDFWRRHACLPASVRAMKTVLYRFLAFQFFPSDPMSRSRQSAPAFIVFGSHQPSRVQQGAPCMAGPSKIERKPVAGTFRPCGRITSPARSPSSRTARESPIGFVPQCFEGR
jgi:hypothetical protein